MNPVALHVLSVKLFIVINLRFATVYAQLLLTSVSTKLVLKSSQNAVIGKSFFFLQFTIQIFETFILIFRSVI